MKRKDWKIKKLKKNIYGKFLKPVTVLFLRKLNLRKKQKLFKKNNISNFYFYNSLLSFIKLKKFFYLKKLFKFYKNSQKIIIFPNYSIFKNIFGLNNAFNSFLSTNNFKSIFINNNISSNIKGLSKILINKDSFSKTPNFSKFDINDDNYKNMFFFKTDNLIPLAEYNFSNIYNFFFNFNLTVFNILEIYKLLLILYINKSK